MTLAMMVWPPSWAGLKIRQLSLIRDMIQSCSMWARMSRAFSTLPSSGLDISVSLETTFSFVRFCARMSRGDSFLREAPSFMRAWTDLRHNVSMSFSLSSVLGDILAPSMELVHVWKALVPLVCNCSFAEHAVTHNVYKIASSAFRMVYKPSLT